MNHQKVYHIFYTEKINGVVVETSGQPGDDREKLGDRPSPSPSPEGTRGAAVDKLQCHSPLQQRSNKTTTADCQASHVKITAGRRMIVYGYTKSNPQPRRCYWPFLSPHKCSDKKKCFGLLSEAGSCASLAAEVLAMRLMYRTSTMSSIF